MSKNAISILFITFLLMSCGTADDTDDVQSYLDATTRLYQEKNEDTAAIAELLTKGLNNHPDSLPLLQSRANLYCSRGKLFECRADTQRLLELRPNLAEARMMLCMLDEFEGADEKSCEVCYSAVAELLSALPQPDSPEKEISNKFNYVFALLMANSPEAETEKSVFLSRVASEPQARMFQGLLENFNRKRALREILGK